MSNVIMEMTKEYSPVNQNARLGGIMDKWDRTGLHKNLSEDKSQVIAQSSDQVSKAYPLMKKGTIKFTNDDNIVKKCS